MITRSSDLNAETMPYLLIGGKKMLEEVKVGGMVYDVEFKELDSTDGVQLGWCDYAKSKIEINNHNISERKQKQTIIHELTHAIMHEAGVGFGDDDERVVNHIGLVLHQVLKDNDFSWLREGEETTGIVVGGGKDLYLKNKEWREVD